jgi:hypothetical protein
MGKLPVFARTAYTNGPISADQHKQIGIRGGARSFQLRGGFMKQNGNFEKSEKLRADQKILKTSSCT